MPPSPPPPAPPSPPWPPSPAVDLNPDDTRGGTPTTGEGDLAETRPNSRPGPPALLLLYAACRPPLVVAVDVDVALPEIPPNPRDSDTHESSTSKLVKARAPEVCGIITLDALFGCTSLLANLGGIVDVLFAG